MRTPTGTVLCDEADPASKPCALPGDSPFGFGGSWRSPQTGLSWMGARWYAPKLAQFLSSDPLGYIDAYDSYGYAAFDPINRWDPSGLASQSFSEPAPWERFSWYVWGAVHGLSPGPLPGLYDSPASAALQAQFDDGFRNGALAGMVGSAFVAKVGGGAASTLGATGPGCLATAGPSMGTGCLPMAASLVGVGVAGSGAYLGAVYADKLATVGPGAPTRMSRVDDGGAETIGATGKPTSRPATAQTTEPTLPPKKLAEQHDVVIEHYYRSGDHGPAHAHVHGGGPSTRIGPAGKPLKGQPAMTSAQQAVYDANKSAVRRAINKRVRIVWNDGGVV